MAHMVRVRVELKHYNPHASYDERETGFRRMFTAFKKAYGDIRHSYKEHESFESRSRRRRRKKRESELQRLKTKLKENFTPQREPHD